MGKKRIIAGLDLYDDIDESNDSKVKSPRDFENIRFQDMTISDIITLVGKYGFKIICTLDNNGRPVITIESGNTSKSSPNEKHDKIDEYDLTPIVRNSNSRKTNLSNLWK